MQLELIINLRGTPDGTDDLLRRLLAIGVRAEGLGGEYLATATVVDDEGIQSVNRTQRGIDRPTDVLSFPSVDYRGRTAAQCPGQLRRELDPETGCIFLGDIVLSLPRARVQAEEYGHSLTREIGFLFVHGLLHLMGYDHQTEAQRAQMRAMEDTIMDKAGLTRELTDADYALVSGARAAMQRAYAPYSHYRVGACVLTADGRQFCGCNVENASFGMTICAERNAITTAIAEGATAIEAIAIAAEGPMPFPCGACRQFMREFARDMRIIVAGEDRTVVTTLSALLPESFGPEAIAAVDSAREEACE